MEITIDITQIALRLLGAFYTLAGYVASRAALTSRLMDYAIAAIGSTKPDRRESARAFWLLASAVVVFAGGIALFLLLDIAPWLFVLSALGQALYLLVLAPLYFDVVDPPDETGRRQSTNAFLIYTIATALIIWAAMNGKFVPWLSSWPLLTAFLAAVAAHVWYVAWHMLRPLPSSPYSDFASSMGGAGDPKELAQSRSIKVMADYDCHPLWAMDPGIYGDFPPQDLGLSEELCRDLEDWARSFDASLNRENPAETSVTPEQQAAHELKGRQLAIRVARERPDLAIWAYELETGVVRVYAEDAL